MKNSKIYNTDKNRKATANEIAKYLIMDKLEQIVINEAYGLEDITEDETHEIGRFLSNHFYSLRKKFNPNQTVFRVK